MRANLHSNANDANLRQGCEMEAKKADSRARSADSSDALALPPHGFTRWNTLKLYVPMSREAIRLREIAGRFPKRVQLGSARCVGWRNEDLHAYFRDPDGFRSESEPRAALA
jgi:prophage regulatory protein